MGSEILSDTNNEVGGSAHDLTAAQALAQLAATGTLAGVHYATSEALLKRLRAVADQVHPELLARTAIYARQVGMKDVPALLCAMLSKADTRLFQRVFKQVIDTPVLLRSFVRVMRSGAAGRRSLGSAPRRSIRRWLAARGDEDLFRASVGQDPSLVDIIKMVHPRPDTPSRRALYGYLLKRPHDVSLLPTLVRDYEAFKLGHTSKVPDVDFRQLTSLHLTRDQWAAVAWRGDWQQTRLNLNAYARRGVFRVPGTTEVVVSKLRDHGSGSTQPYELFVTYRALTPDVPFIVGEAVQDAMDVALQSLPAIPGQTWVLPDVSSSMSSPLTGKRSGGSTTVTCRDVASLVAAALLWRDRSTQVLPFAHQVVPCRLNPRDTVMTNTEKLSALRPGGETRCSAPLAELNARKARGDLVVLVTDGQTRESDPATLREWDRFKQRSPQARLVCVDLQPYATTPVPGRKDILNVGGFSDRVFPILADFAAGRLKPDPWVGVIEQVELES